MFGKNFQRKYALSDQGIKNTKQATLWTVIVNLIVMGGMGILYFMMKGFTDTLINGDPLPNALLILGLVILFVMLSLITHMQQYRATYGLVYGEVKYGLAWRSVCGNFRWDTSENGIWRI